ncbi:MAG: SRPBCC domain-containing protein [Devosia sp.]
MDFGGRYLFGARRDVVWVALNDTRVLKAVIPGCERIEWTGPASLDLSIKVNLGIAHPVFVGDLTLSDVHPAEHYVLSARGRGGVLGMAQAAARIAIADAPDGTLLSFTADGNADGGVMRLGRALIGKSAQRVIDGFFESIGREMGAIVKALPPG